MFPWEKQHSSSIMYHNDTFRRVKDRRLMRANPGLTHYTYNGTNGDISVPLLPPGFCSRSNVYTIVVGKNGIGKSRLLAELARERINEEAYKVVAISTSPFDKFPSSRRTTSQLQQHYAYVGMRDGLYANSSSVSLIASAAKGLIRKLAEKERLASLAHVFESMELAPYARFSFKLSTQYASRLERERGGYAYPEDERLWQLSKILGFPLSPQQVSKLTQLSDEHLEQLYLMASQSKAEGRRIPVASSIEVRFDYNQASTNSERVSRTALRTLSLALEVGLVRLIDLELVKHSFGTLSLRRASSGEQCMLVMLLGIAGHIEDGALVLIDEPEISLHPKWQEDFIQMLMQAFSNYQGCQFVIATHSPQIISRLIGHDCFVASLSNGKLYSASDFSSRSADFQLAELFDAPGLMNEYIARLAFSVMARLKARENVSIEIAKDFNHLESLSRHVENNDPTRELVNSVAEIFKYYANRR
jgi:predicted ATPase